MSGIYVAPVSGNATTGRAVVTRPDRHAGAAVTVIAPLFFFSMPGIELRLFGTPSISGRPGAADVLTRPKRFAVLAWLACARPAGLQRRDRAIGMFWPERSDQAARNALRQSLHALRAALGEDAVIARGDDEVGLNPDVVHADVSRFRAAIEQGHLARALELYRADLLDGVDAGADGFAPWLATERELLRDAAAEAAWSLAQGYESDGDPTRASRWARKAARLARTDERRIRRVIRLLYQAGDRAGAMQVYEEFRTFLSREFSVTPADETERLIAAVRDGTLSD